MELTPVEIRVVGSLVEKELTTPQYYPLTLNALVAACNQTSNRSPVLDLDESDVRAAVDSLKERGLARIVHSPSNRALKFRQVLHEVFALEREELAVLGVLFLRGPQTVGELRSRTERMVELTGLDQVDEIVTRLEEKAAPLVVRLARQPGQKEGRIAHLLGAGDPGELPPVVDPVAGVTDPARSGPGPDRVGVLEATVAELTTMVEALRAELEELRAEWGSP